MKEISINDVGNVKIGQTEDMTGGTGCTVIISENGMPAGSDVRGGGPASRESELLNPLAAAQAVHAVILSGGSAFGLDAAGGVMAELEERGIGYEVGPTRVPLAVQADLFDLTVGDPHARPDFEMGRKAARIALEGGNYRDGCFGAGTGATVGKARGMERCMKSGIGSYAIQLGKLKIGAIVAVNALGDVFDYRNGKQLAGLLDEQKTAMSSSKQALLELTQPVENKFTGNTTIGVIITNAAFDKTRLCKIASMGQDGMARAINPVHTSADGDTLFAVSCGDVRADMDLTGTLAADVVSEAIARAVKSAVSMYGYISAADLEK